jgi:hypothetical protein
MREKRKDSTTSGVNQIYRADLSRANSAGRGVMTSQSAARRQEQGEVNPKIGPAPNSNRKKGPNDRVSGDDPMTGAQASYLKTLSEECGEPDNFTSDRGEVRHGAGKRQ